LNQYSVEAEETFTVTLDTNGGENMDSLIVPENVKITLPTPQREGFEFAGWYFDTEFINACSQEYTFEVGSGENPLPLSQFAQIYRDNVPLLNIAALGLG
jgi:hypothetical protein